jgi:hypothetical protein
MNFQIVTQKPSNNPVTPNPSIELIELCNLAVDCVKGTATLSQFTAKADSLQNSETQLRLNISFVYGNLDITFLHSTLSDDIRHQFIADGNKFELSAYLRS